MGLGKECTAEVEEDIGPHWIHTSCGDVQPKPRRVQCDTYEQPVFSCETEGRYVQLSAMANVWSAL